MVKVGQVYTNIFNGQNHEVTAIHGKVIWLDHHSPVHVDEITNGTLVLKCDGHDFSVKKLSGWLCSKCDTFTSKKP